MRYYPLAHLAAATGLTEAALARYVGLSGTTLKKARERGLREDAADRHAVKAGLHPAEVWPDFGKAACPECGTLFAPVRRSHRHCTRDCYQRQYKRALYRARYAADETFRQAELERSRATKAANVRGRQIKKAAYYQANREAILAAKRARLARTREEAA